MTLCQIHREGGEAREEEEEEEEGHGGMSASPERHGFTGWMERRLPNLKCWITGNFSMHWRERGEGGGRERGS